MATKFEELLDKLSSISEKAGQQRDAKDSDAKVFANVLPMLAVVSKMLDRECGPGYHRDENGNCVPD